MSRETGCECSELELHDGRCAGCGRSVLERVSRPGRPGADYEVLLREVRGLRAQRDAVLRALSNRRVGPWLQVRDARRVLCTDPTVLAGSCSPVESAARAVAPWCADHVRESEGSRQPKDGAA